MRKNRWDNGKQQELAMTQPFDKRPYQRRDKQDRQEVAGNRQTDDNALVQQGQRIVGGTDIQREERDWQRVSRCEQEQGNSHVVQKGELQIIR
jgi:hypothetical protein